MEHGELYTVAVKSGSFTVILVETAWRRVQRRSVPFWVRPNTGRAHREPGCVLNTLYGWSSEFWTETPMAGPRVLSTLDRRLVIFAPMTCISSRLVVSRTFRTITLAAAVVLDGVDSRYSVYVHYGSAVPGGLVRVNQHQPDKDSM